MKKYRGVRWIILLFFITLWRYWHLITPNKELREYILRDFRDFIQGGQEIAFLSALKKGELLIWDVTTGGVVREDYKVRVPSPQLSYPIQSTSGRCYRDCLY